MDHTERWSREALDRAFDESDPSARLLDSFGRRVFRHDGKIIKYGEPVDPREARTLSFIRRSGLTIPVPKVYSSGRCGDTGFIEMEMVEGTTLDKIWDRLSEQERHSYAQQLRQIVNQLRSLEGSYIGALEQGPVVDSRRDRQCGGPFQTEAAFNQFLLSNTISTMPKIYRTMLESLLAGKAHRILFTHGDLTPTNIIVNEGCIVGVLDWENAGWYPEHWEFLQFFRGVYRGYREYGDVIFEVLYPEEFMVDSFIGKLTRH